MRQRVREAGARRAPHAPSESGQPTPPPCRRPSSGCARGEGPGGRRGEGRGCRNRGAPAPHRSGVAVRQVAVAPGDRQSEAQPSQFRDPLRSEADRHRLDPRGAAVDAFAASRQSSAKPASADRSDSPSPSPRSPSAERTSGLTSAEAQDFEVAAPPPEVPVPPSRRRSPPRVRLQQVHPTIGRTPARSHCRPPARLPPAAQSSRTDRLGPTPPPAAHRAARAARQVVAAVGSSMPSTPRTAARRNARAPGLPSRSASGTWTGSARPAARAKPDASSPGEQRSDSRSSVLPIGNGAVVAASQDRGGDEAQRRGSRKRRPSTLAVDSLFQPTSGHSGLR